MTGQTVGDLRTLVTRRAGLRRKVALLAADASLTTALEQNGCTVLVDPESLDAVTAFHPDVVVAFDGFAAEGAAGFTRLAQAAPGAELVFSFANASASSVLLRALLGVSPAPTSSERDVRAWLREAGFVVSSRDVVVTPHVDSGLSADTEAALRQLFEQLNPDAAADRLLLVAKRGAEASVPERTAGLTTVIVSGGEDAAALEGTLRSAAGQLQSPLELMVISPLPELRLEELAKAAKGRAGLTLVLVGEAPADALERTNFGLSRARGQYVCCLEAGELLDRSHVSSLVERLKAGTEAWALSSPPVDLGRRFELKAWLDAGAVQRGRYVVDRERIGTFPLSFATGLELGEAMVFCRLAALFPPAWNASAPTLDSPRTVNASASALLEAMRSRPLRTMGSLADGLQEPAPVDVVEVLNERLAQKSEVAGRVLGQARGLVERVRDAAVKARAQAKLEKK
ncbi:MAG: glycosyltransferase family A protein [Archangium sp.]|nr:glycosyltransferase family A protein [Archangium sp.]MDP3157027.1 glycosyltransferase family A protein [Archangium sp.]MDP3575744.1 glycosyltransferase family A protein [Archangium sp.]